MSKLYYHQSASSRQHLRISVTKHLGGSEPVLAPAISLAGAVACHISGQVHKVGALVFYAIDNQLGAGLRPGQAQDLMQTPLVEGQGPFKLAVAICCVFGAPSASSDTSLARAWDRLWPLRRRIMSRLRQRSCSSRLRPVGGASQAALWVPWGAASRGFEVARPTSQADHSVAPSPLSGEGTWSSTRPRGGDGGRVFFFFLYSTTAGWWWWCWDPFWCTNKSPNVSDPTRVHFWMADCCGCCPVGMLVVAMMMTTRWGRAPGRQWGGSMRHLVPGGTEGCTAWRCPFYFTSAAGRYSTLSQLEIIPSGLSPTQSSLDQPMDSRNSLTRSWAKASVGLGWSGQAINGMISLHKVT